MKKKTLCCMMALLLLSLGTASLSSADEMKKGGRFAKIDTNGDGKIDFNEFKKRSDARVEAAFKAADANGDGSISPEELRNAQKERKRR